MLLVFSAASVVFVLVWNCRMDVVVAATVEEAVVVDMDVEEVIVRVDLEVEGKLLGTRSLARRYVCVRKSDVYLRFLRFRNSKQIFSPFLPFSPSPPIQLLSPSLLVIT
jgi:hypothetical protein